MAGEEGERRTVSSSRALEECKLLKVVADIS